MADKIDKIPEKTRWEVSTKGLTGAYAAISTALKEAQANVTESIGKLRRGK